MPQSSLRRGERGEFVRDARAQYRNERVRDFQNMLDVTEWNISDFMGVLKTKTDTVTEWMRGKPDEWHQNLYTVIGDSLPVHKHILINLRIVRCNDDTYRIGRECFFSSDDLDENLSSAATASEVASQIVFDEEEAKYIDALPRVSKDVYSSGKSKNQQEKARAFLEGIGVSEIGPSEWVTAVLKQRYTKPFQPRVEDMERFIAFAESEPDKVSLFKDYSIFRIDKTLENKNWWGSHQSVFLDSPYLATGLTTYYEVLSDETSHRWALSPEYKDAGIEPERIGKFAKALGAQSKLGPKKQEMTHAKWLSMALRDTGGWSERYGINEDYDMPEFDTLLAKPDLSRSRLIWDTMNELPECCLKARYRSNSWYAPQSDNSILVDKLRQNNWVPQTQGGQNPVYFVKPSEADVELLPKGFSYEHQSSCCRLLNLERISEIVRRLNVVENNKQLTNISAKVMLPKTLGFLPLRKLKKWRKYREKILSLLQDGRLRSRSQIFQRRHLRIPNAGESNLLHNTPMLFRRNMRRDQESVRTSQTSIDLIPISRLNIQMTLTR